MIDHAALAAKLEAWKKDQVPTFRDLAGRIGIERHEFAQALDGNLTDANKILHICAYLGIEPGEIFKRARDES